MLRTKGTVQPVHNEECENYILKTLPATNSGAPFLAQTLKPVPFVRG